MKIYLINFYPFDMLMHILLGLYCCTYSALTSLTFHSLHPTKGVIQPFTFQLCVTTWILKGILIWFTHEPLIHTHCCLYSQIALQRANNHKNKDKERLVQVFWFFFFFNRRGGNWVTRCYELLSSSCEVPGSNW